MSAQCLLHNTYNSWQRECIALVECVEVSGPHQECGVENEEEQIQGCSDDA